MIKQRVLNFCFVFIIFLIDRFTKILIINFAEGNDEKNIFITSFLNLNLIWNDGIAFGMFSFEEKAYYNFLTIIIILITIVIFWMILKSEKLEKYDDFWWISW